MRYVASFALLLALQICSPEAQVKKGGGGPQPPAAGREKTTGPREDAALICIDPGHPSEVASGMNVQNGTSETHVAWVVALGLQKELEAAGYRVVLTKQAEDQLVKNKDRAVTANRARAALMVRLHCDASTERGYAVYFPDRQGRAKDGTAGPSPQVVEASRRAAEAVHAGMAEVLDGALSDNGVRTDFQTKVGREQGGALTGSIFSEVPVVTIEMVVLSDRGDAEFIKSEEGQRRMAAAIAEGIKRFVGPTVAPRGKD